MHRWQYEVNELKRYAVVNTTTGNIIKKSTGELALYERLYQAQKYAIKVKRTSCECAVVTVKIAGEC